MTTSHSSRLYSSKYSTQTGNDDDEASKTTSSNTTPTKDKTQINSSTTTSLSDLSTNDLKLAMDVATQTTQTDPQTTTTESTDSTFLQLDDIPGTGSSYDKPTRQLAIIYTCNVCNTRSAKKFTERAYNHGVVLVRCPNCESLHLIADRLGYFSDDNDDIPSGDDDRHEGNNKQENMKKGWDIEKFMKQIGREDNIKVVTGGDMNDVLEVTLEDVLGSDKINMNTNVDKEHEKEKH